ncbi:hypothetical protein [Usitatibacter palustris]|uniref:DUF4124 domain-containing protein n=1 Tax=Usitatibacter palustris TaxID=2732487 RepID=A0A6M4HEI0_9PROT|nr:hypothetical protein [Usitatibacter palustris]QJR16397.1 hypothetical protein DSM104440_03231 [Usitatibacter palustris]
MRASALFVLALAAAAPAAALEIGTLFHTPEERQKLDRMRRGEPERTTTAPMERTTVPQITGYVQRSDGKNTLWLDGQPVPTNNPRATPLLDPRKVQDEGPQLPPRSIQALPPAPEPKR